MRESTTPSEGVQGRFAEKMASWWLERGGGSQTPSEGVKKMRESTTPSEGVEKMR